MTQLIQISNRHVVQCNDPLNITPPVPVPPVFSLCLPTASRMYEHAATYAGRAWVLVFWMTEYELQTEILTAPTLLPPPPIIIIIIRSNNSVHDDIRIIAIQPEHLSENNIIGKEAKIWQHRFGKGCYFPL